MSLNNQELTLFAKEFKQLLPLKIEKLYIPEENILLLTLYKKDFKKHLFIEVASNYSGLYFVKERPKQNLPANIQSRFRNLLLNGLITDIEQINNDRILNLTIGNYNLILELTGRHGNIFILKNNNIEGVLLLNKKDKKRKLSLYSQYEYPVILNDTSTETKEQIQKTPTTSFLDYLENEYSQNIINLKKKQIEEQIKNQINRKIKKLKNKKKNLLKDLEKLNSYKDYKNYGELLKANLYQLKRGMENIKIVNYYSDDMSEIEIKLNKTQTPIQNMEFYFKKHEKYKRGVTFIEKELKKIEHSIYKTENTPQNTDNIEKIQDKKKKKIQNTHTPYKTYLSTKGFKILVGKGSTDNDYLTFKIASGNDIWLHVLSYSGSHVVIKKNNKKDIIDINTIYEAAHLAILNSKAPKNDSIEVCYTFRKFVKKPPKSKPGAVIYTQEKRLYLQLNQEVVNNLKFI